MVLDLWFDAWEKVLGETGFFETDISGNHTILDCRLHNILNFDETSLSLDGSTIS